MLWNSGVGEDSWESLGQQGDPTVHPKGNQFSSVNQLCPTLCDHMNHRTPGLPVHHQLPESTKTHVHWVSDAIQPSHPLLSSSPLCPQSFPATVFFSNESTLHIRWPKYWSFSFNISPSSEYPGLISFRMDWLDFLAVSQESSPTPQFKSISSLALSFLHSPTLTSTQSLLTIDKYAHQKASLSLTY